MSINIFSIKNYIVTLLIALILVQSTPPNSLILQHKFFMKPCLSLFSRSISSILWNYWGFIPYSVKESKPYSETPCFQRFATKPDFNKILFMLLKYCSEFPPRHHLVNARSLIKTPEIPNMHLTFGSELKFFLHNQMHTSIYSLLKSINKNFKKAVPSSEKTWISSKRKTSAIWLAYE